MGEDARPDPPTARRRVVAWVGAATVLLGLGGLAVFAAVRGELGEPWVVQAGSAGAAGWLLLLGNLAGLLRGGDDLGPDGRLGLAGEFGPWLGRKLGALVVDLAPAVVLVVVHLGAFAAGGVVEPLGVALAAGVLVVTPLAGAVQALTLRLYLPVFGLALAVSLLVLLVEAVLPLVCCLPSFNPALAVFFVLLPPPSVGAGGGSSYPVALALATGVSLGAQVVMGAVLVLLGWLRFRSLRDQAPAPAFEGPLAACRHCGERVPEAADPCPVCGEPAPFRPAKPAGG